MIKTNKIPMLTLWEGVPIEELEKTELIEAIKWCGSEIQSLQKERSRLFKACDPIKYLMNN